MSRNYYYIPNQGGIFMYKKFETTFAGKPLVVETGKMAVQANGSCLVR